jgi:hypothetical protein
VIVISDSDDEFNVKEETDVDDDASTCISYETGDSRVFSDSEDYNVFSDSERNVASIVSLDQFDHLSDAESESDVVNSDASTTSGE